MTWALLLIGVSLAGIGGFALYPLLLRMMAVVPAKPVQREARPHSLSILLAVRNGAALLPEKLADLKALSPPGPLQILIYSDGSTDDTAAYLKAHAWEGVTVFVTQVQRGKAWCLTQMLPHATGDILLFTDADALFAPNAVARLLAPFADPTVGGVCGRRVINSKEGEAASPQQDYIGMDSRIKMLETGLGSITSNDGKLYAVRAHAARPVPGPVTDDLWMALGVVLKGYRFIYEPEARVFIRLPARSLAHECARRRRIVSTSLNGMARSAAIFNPFRFPRYALCLWLNKVDRRLLPLWLLGCMAGCLALGRTYPAATYLGLAQVAVYLGTAVYHVTGIGRLLPRPLRRLGDKAVYVLTGFWGMLLGLWDFVLGRTPSQWEPKKSD